MQLVGLGYKFKPVLNVDTSIVQSYSDIMMRNLVYNEALLCNRIRQPELFDAAFLP